ncbi:DeoR/GlpR family DNA-binding transcription regulator [Amphibacillus sediminis]|uniref:DeoR/GlpR family DNA-binding transcription regulator n=1 Tax=Amphibacillus sediminis TaxID=360185 RepID=UPI00082A5491|nr:DeoR/GlpR family DNA-binding transcription regulator [Amphibacillus sediminis]
MFTAERRQLIMELLKQEHRVTVKQLSKNLNVSEVTLRTDLNEMEKQGLLLRTHGGAILNETLNDEDSFLERSKKNIENKKTLSYKALDLIEEKSCILLDASTTVLELAKLLKHYDKKLTILTNGISSAIELKENPYLTVILIGGVLRAGSMALEGQIGTDVLDNINEIDLLFTSASGFTLESGLTDFNVYEVDLKSQMVQKSKKVIALLDHTKFGHNSIATFAKSSQIDLVITDQQPSEDIINQLKQLNIEVMY